MFQGQAFQGDAFQIGVNDAVIPPVVVPVDRWRPARYRTGAWVNWWKRPHMRMRRRGR